MVTIYNRGREFLSIANSSYNPVDLIVRLNRHWLCRLSWSQYLRLQQQQHRTNAIPFEGDGGGGEAGADQDGLHWTLR